MRIKLCLCLSLSLSVPASASVIEIKAVAVNGVPIVRTPTVQARPGDVIEADLFLSDWENDLPSEALLRGVQVVMDSAAWVSGTSGAVTPAFYNRAPQGFLCDDYPVCVEEDSCVFNGIESLCEPNRCVTDADCGPTWPICSGPRGTSSYCVGPGDILQPGAFFIDRSRPDLVFAGLTAFHIIANDSFLTTYASGADSAATSIPDPGRPVYLGTLPLGVSTIESFWGEASGVFTIAPLDVDGTSAVFTDTSVRPPRPTLIPLTVRIVQPEPEPESIPAVSEWGMAAMVLALLVVARIANLRGQSV